MPLPQTVTKLSQSLTLIGVHQVSEAPIPIPEAGATSDLLTLGQNLADFAASFKRIGAVWGFKADQSRTNKERRGLDNAVEPFAMIPGPITTTLTMNRAVLYLQDAMAAFNFLPGNIAFQTRPLILLEITKIPQGVNVAQILGLQFDLTLSNPMIYVNCWISGMSTSYDLKGGDQMVVQDLTLNVARIVNPLSLIPGVGDQGVRELAQNMSIVNLARNIPGAPGTTTPSVIPGVSR
jgi:hypothetical protein